MPAIDPLTTEACEIMLNLVRAVNGLQYPLPKSVALRVNALEDFVRAHYPVPF
jgi:hypothetical protein